MFYHLVVQSLKYLTILRKVAKDMQIGMSSAKPDDILKNLWRTMAATNSCSFDRLLALSCSLQHCAVTGMEELIYLGTEDQSWQDVLAASAAVGNIGIMRTAFCRCPGCFSSRLSCSSERQSASQLHRQAD